MELGIPVFLGVRWEREANDGPIRRRAHGGEVADVYGKGFVADVDGGGIFRKMDSADQGVDGDGKFDSGGQRYLGGMAAVLRGCLGAFLHSAIEPDSVLFIEERRAVTGKDYGD